MNDKIRKYLSDIRASIDSTVEYVGECDFAAYSNNKMMRRAVERELEIIGEATNRILRIEPDFTLENAKGIIGLRNFVAHQYENVADTEIWGIVKKHLPKLRAEVETLLNE